MNKPNLVAQLLKKLAPRIGARVILEPKWNVVGQIAFKSGCKRYFRYSTLDLNRMGASEIARDKDYAKFFMKKMGYRVIPGKAFCSPSWARKIGSTESTAAARVYARKMRYPLIVKPNSKSQGRGVTKVRSPQEFNAAFRAVSAMDNMVIVERYLSGQDYRIVVLDNKVISAYERIPLSVVGDGTTSIKVLLARKQVEFKKTGRDTILKPRDPRIAQTLREKGMTLRSKPAKGERVFLLSNANLSSGGDSVDVTERVHRSIQKLAISLTRDMGLRFCGVDLMLVQPIDQPLRKNAYWVIEINSAPGLDHYATIGKKQERIVEDLYTEVLGAMDTPY